MKNMWQLALTFVNCKILTFTLKKYFIQYFCHLKLKYHLLFLFLPSYQTHIERRNGIFPSYQLNAHSLYSITIYMLHYNPQHVSSSTLLIFRRTNCIIRASGIVTLYAG